MIPAEIISRVKTTQAKSPSCSGRRNSRIASPIERLGCAAMGARPSLRAAQIVGISVSRMTAMKTR